MQYTIIDDTDQNYFIVETSGVLDLDTHNHMLSDLVGHKNWRKGKKVLVDHRKTSFDSLTMQGIAEVASIVGMIDNQYGASHLAIVVNVEGLEKATIYKLEAFRKSKVNTKVFPEEEYQAAVEWISNQSTGPSLVIK